MITTRTSPRRDGRTAARVSDEDVQREVLRLFEDAEARGDHRPTLNAIRDHLRGRGCGVGDLRLEAILDAIEDELPDLPLTRGQLGGRATRTRDRVPPEPPGFWAEQDQRQCDEFAAGLKEAREEKERALRGRGRPKPEGPTIADLVGQVRAAERRIGLKGGGE